MKKDSTSKRINSENDSINVLPPSAITAKWSSKFITVCLHINTPSYVHLRINTPATDIANMFNTENANIPRNYDDEREGRKEGNVRVNFHEDKSATNDDDDRRTRQNAPFVEPAAHPLRCVYARS